MDSTCLTPETPLETAIRVAGGQTALAQKITVAGRKCTQQSVSWWLNKAGHKVPPEYCKYIEAATDRAVTKEALRPEVFGDQPAPAQQQAA